MNTMSRFPRLSDHACGAGATGMRLSAARIGRARAVTGASAALLAVLLCGCQSVAQTGDANTGGTASPDTGGTSSSACDVISGDALQRAIGTVTPRVSDESVGRDGSTPRQLVCRYVPNDDQVGVDDGPALVLRAVQETETGRAERDIRATEQSCEGAQSLSLADAFGFVCPTGDLGGGPQAYAAWDGLDVRVAFTQSRETSDAAASELGAVMSELRGSLSKQSLG